MFDAQEIGKETANQVAGHLTALLMKTFFVSGQFTAADGVPISTAALMPEHSAIYEYVNQLARVANGEVERDTADDFFVGEIGETIQTVCEMLFSVPGSYQYQIPVHFWGTGLGQVILHCQLWMRGDDLITHTEAAQILYGDNSKASLNKVRRLVENNEIRGYIDPHENNPTRNKRVSRGEIEGKKADDS